MIKAILIDDEEIALDVLEILLLEVGGVTVAGKFQLLHQAVEQSAQIDPDLIFLDIEMPGTNGLAAAEALFASYPGVEIIFVTAHHQYAIDAFDTNAIGYLLKPVAKERLVKTLSRYAELHTREARRSKDDSSGKDSALTARPLSLRVLGSMELYDADGRLITWRTKKAKEMFAFLWYHGGSPVYRYNILDQLWPDTSPERAQTLFHTTLYYVRNTLKTAGHPDMIAFGDERYWMRPEGVLSDLARVEDIMRQGGYSEELLALYRGDFLETEYYSWSESRRYELRNAYIAFLEQASEAADGSLKDRLLRRLIELDPYREKHYDRLLAYLTDSGDAAAIDKLNRTRDQILGQELGKESKRVR